VGLRAISRIATAIVIACLVVYAADAAWLFARAAARRPTTGSVQVRVMLAVPRKDGRVEFTPGAVESQPCVRALFPHRGLGPCWYAERHTRKEIDY
jgi:hypothetical protein